MSDRLARRPQAAPSTHCCELKALHDTGDLSNEEFDAARRKVLAG